MRKALVSIIMPVYNAEKYLCNTIESILAQTYQEIELICVDDGSIDNSLKILKEYRSCDNRIHILSQKNQYAGIARNKGKEIARGEYIIFLDADDLFERDLIEKVVYKAEETDAQIVIFDAWLYSDKTQERRSADWILNKRLIPDKNTFSAKDCAKDVFNISTTAAWNKLYNRDYIEKEGILFQNTKHINDLLFTSCVIALAERISILDEKLMAYRIENKNSLQGKKERVLDFIEAFKALFEFLNCEGIWNIYQESYIKFCFNNIVEYLHQQNTVKDFEQFYELAKEELLPLLDWKSTDLFENEYLYDRFSHIHNDTAKEYLFFEYMYERGRDASLCKTIKELEEDADNANNYIKGMESIVHKKTWEFPFEAILPGSKVIIYGAGDVGKDFYRQLAYNRDYELVGWVDSNYGQVRKVYRCVEPPEKIKEKEFDYIIIAVIDKEIAGSIESYLLKSGISDRKIILYEI